MGKKGGSAKKKQPEAAQADDAGPSTSALPEHVAQRLKEQQEYVICTQDVNYNTNSTLAANQYMAAGVDHAFSLPRFKRDFSINITRYEGPDMEFEMKGASCALANSLRRVMISETPTMAIEHVYVINNTSVIQDEVLAHRLGLVPLQVDPERFGYRSKEEAPSEKNTIVLKLKVECRKAADGTFENDKWLPGGSEYPEETATHFAGSQTEVVADVRPVHDDILIAKLRPGQAIELEAHCVKGVGEEHAKWSPVATAWYRLKPEVALLQAPRGALAAELAAELPGLFTLVGAGEGASVALGDPLQHDKLLEKLRRLSSEDKWRPYLQLRKRKNHFLWMVESTGAWRPHELFAYAVRVMISKADKVLEGLQQYPQRSWDWEAE
eukprot:scaffold25.g5135.t1